MKKSLAVERFSSLKKRLNSKLPGKGQKTGWAKGSNGRILFFDIETAPVRGWVWRAYEDNLLKTDKDWYMLSFAYRWADDDQVYVKALSDYPRFKKDKEDDIDLCRDLWELFNEADILVGHNGDAFDIKKANARFIIHKMNPPSSYKSIDTLKIARRYFKFTSNRLNDLAAYLGIGEKLPHTGLHLWFGCMNGDPASWKMMKEYNIHDVKLLVDVYNRLAAWHTTHPDLTLYSGAMMACPKCEGPHMIKKGFVYKGTTKRQQYQCKDCGGWSSAGPPIKKIDPILC